jgi:hypothetical protein
MKSVEGRVTDYIRANDGRSIPGPAFTVAFADLPIRKYQIVQKELGMLSVKVVKDTGYSGDVDQKIISRLREIVGSDIKVEIHYENRILSSTRSGKFLPVVSEISYDRT